MSEGLSINQNVNTEVKSHTHVEVLPILKTARLYLTLLLPEQYALLAAYYQDNQSHLAPWEPKRSVDYFIDANIQTRLNDNLRAYFQEKAVHWVAFQHQDVSSTNRLNQGLLSLSLDAKVIGVCNFTNIIQGPFQACHLGYSLAAAYQEQGYMQEMLAASIAYAFDELKLHRIMANYLPANTKSAVLLNKLGFEKEGLARDYLHIAGKWQDHVLTSKINNKSAP
ncbi:GNAT family N-acetyltransferase [Shewanella surugensis]|uniref:GNAT family N-acetyltransferase n=1 Tax=Shewanella surugensis TaxID=212020 RepID=A0ABT0LFV2_9GAMM|nr:GNAT family N-acetyltransferase [Shewanella surugensis]MCL1126036.1 GNAT family N-acetyltransferase [Shewanella surugensis]